MWLDGYNQFTQINTGGSYLTYSLFVTDNGDIYVDNGTNNSRVDRWIPNAGKSAPVMPINNACYGMFIDINSTLYCSIQGLHHIVKKSLASSVNQPVIAAGTNCPGPAPNMLYNPLGIFVDINLDLYVADCGNNRIQQFKSGELNGTTVAGNGASDDIVLSCPSGIVLDANGYLFIVDADNNRIIGSGPDGFRCLVGCFGEGSTPDKLAFPGSLSFDSYGNMFVTDWGNARIQKFLLSTNSCSKCLLVL
jgi:hypothetical protein